MRGAMDDSSRLDDDVQRILAKRRQRLQASGLKTAAAPPRDSGGRAGDAPAADVAESWSWSVLSAGRRAAAGPASATPLASPRSDSASSYGAPSSPLILASEDHELRHAEVRLPPHARHRVRSSASSGGGSSAPLSPRLASPGEGESDRVRPYHPRGAPHAGEPAAPSAAWLPGVGRPPAPSASPRGRSPHSKLHRHVSAPAAAASPAPEAPQRAPSPSSRPAASPLSAGRSSPGHAADAARLGASPSPAGLCGAGPAAHRPTGASSREGASDRGSGRGSLSSRSLRRPAPSPPRHASGGGLGRRNSDLARTSAQRAPSSPKADASVGPAERATGQRWARSTTAAASAASDGERPSSPSTARPPRPANGTPSADQRGSTGAGTLLGDRAGRAAGPEQLGSASEAPPVPEVGAGRGSGQPHAEGQRRPAPAKSPWARSVAAGAMPRAYSPYPPGAAEASAGSQEPTPGAGREARLARPSPSSSRAAESAPRRRADGAGRGGRVLLMDLTGAASPPAGREPADHPALEAVRVPGAPAASTVPGARRRVQLAGTPRRAGAGPAGPGAAFDLAGPESVREAASQTPGSGQRSGMRPGDEEPPSGGGGPRAIEQPEASWLSPREAASLLARSRPGDGSSSAPGPARGLMPALPVVGMGGHEAALSRLLSPLIEQARALVSPAIRGSFLLYLNPTPNPRDGGVDHVPVRVWLRLSDAMDTLEWTQSVEQPAASSASARTEVRPDTPARHWRIPLRDIALVACGRSSLAAGARAVLRRSTTRPGESEPLAQCLFSLAVPSFALPVEFIANSPDQRADWVAGLALVCSLLPARRARSPE